MAFQYQPSTIDEYSEYAADAFRSGMGLQVTMNPDTGEFTGLVAVESGTPFARQIAEHAEARRSTLNT